MKKGSKKEGALILAAYKMPKELLDDLDFMASSIYKQTGYKVSTAAIVRKATKSLVDAWKLENK